MSKGQIPLRRFILKALLCRFGAISFHIVATRRTRHEREGCIMRMRQCVALLALIVLAFGLVAQAEAKDKAPPYMTVQFSVSDYAAWRPVFDAAEPMRVAANVKNPRIYRSADKPNDILVIFDVGSKKAGRAWIHSPSLRDAWAKGGVIGDPIVGFVSFQQMKEKR